MMKKLKFLQPLSLLVALFAVAFITSCNDDDDEPKVVEDPVASFQFEVDATNFLTVSFTNFSTDATAYSWDFGDGSAENTDSDPTYTYAAAGTYTVTLTAENEEGTTSDKSESVTITNPDAALELLTGSVSKEWKLYRVGTAMSLGPDASNPAGWWAGLSNDGARPCLYSQTFTFHKDGTFVYDDMGMFWGENDPWSGTANHEVCFEPTAGNMVNVDGADVSAWGSGTHAFAYDPSTGVVDLTGMGAWMGLVHTVGNSTYSNIPTASRSFDISIAEETGYDLMTLTYNYGDGGLWTVYYVNYSDTTLEPEIETIAAVFGEDLDDISPTELSNTFATDVDFVLLAPIASGSTIAYGVDDPTDGTATAVGQFNRVDTEAFQELKFQISPDAKDINFENLTTISIDVYIPSTNDYSGALSKVVELGIADQSATEQWWTDIYKYVSVDDLAEDTWVTLTYQIAAPTAVGTESTTPLDRTDLDMFYINIGGGDHVVPGTFFIRNLVIN